MPTQENKYLVFISGGSGAGKGVGESKLVEQGILTGDEVRFDGDSLLGRNPLYQELKSTHRHPEKKDDGLRKEYYSLLKSGVAQAIGQNNNIVIDDHMDNPEVVHDIISDAKAAGYTTLLLGFSASPQAVFAVYHSLSALSGKRADYNWAIHSHKEFASAFEAVAPEFDLATLFYREKYKPGKAIYMYDGRSKQAEIIDEEKYEKFRLWPYANTKASRSENVLPEAGAQEHRDSARGDPAGHVAGTTEDESFVGRIKDTLRNIAIRR